MKKKWIVLVAFSSFSFTSGVFASDGLNEVKAYLNNKVSVFVDDMNVTQNLNGIITYNSTTYLPLRSLSNVLDKEIVWDENTNTIHINNKVSALSPPTSETDNLSTSESDVSNWSNISLGDVVPYKITYNGKDTPILVNYFKNEMFFRSSDVQSMGINISQLKQFDETYTQEKYVHLNDLKKYWSSTPVIDLLKQPVTQQSLSDEQLKVLSRFNGAKETTTGPTVMSINPLSNEDDFRLLFRTNNNSYVIYNVQLGKNSSGSYYIKSYQTVQNK